MVPDVQIGDALQAYNSWRALDLGGSAAMAYMLLFVVTFTASSLSTSSANACWSVRNAKMVHIVESTRPLSGGGTVSYCLLIFWSIIVLFPFYWLLTTAFKLPIDVSSGPKYLPFDDFHPSLDAWHEMRDFIPQPYRNTVIVGLVSSFLALFIGSFAAYALLQLPIPTENWNGCGLHSLRFVGGDSCRGRGVFWWAAY